MFMVQMNAYLNKDGWCIGVKKSRGRTEMLQKLNNIKLFIYFATNKTNYEKCLRLLYKRRIATDDNFFLFFQVLF